MNMLFLLFLLIPISAAREVEKTEETEMDFLRNEIKSMKASLEDTEERLVHVERARNDTEERLDYLEEISKLIVIRTCDEMSGFGITASNYYFVDPDGPLIGSEPFRVYCNFSDDGSATTEVMHDSEDLSEVEHCDEAGCYSHKITYTAPDEQIQSLIQLSEGCEQTIRYDCLLAPLMANDVNLAFWLDKAGQKNVYWYGAHKDEHVCSCFYEENGCLEHSTKFTKCNCDANAPEWAQDIGSITNMTALPITQLQFGGLHYELQQAFHSVGRLRCWGKKKYSEGTSCAAIKRSGQYQNGFFNIRKNETSNSRLVFCNQSVTPGYDENGENEEFINSPEDHIEMVEKDIEGINSEVSVNEGKISAIENGVSINGGKISALENDVSVNGGKISALENDVSVNEGKISALENDVSINQGKISSIENDVSVNEENISGIENDVSINGEKISALENDVSVNQGKISAIENDVYFYGVKISDLENEVSVNRGKISALENDVSVNEGKISALETDVSVNEGNISAIENYVSINGGKISALENDVSVNGGKISVIEIDVSVNAGNISALENDVSENGGKISILENDISANGGKISTLENDVSVNGGKISTLENVVSTNEGKISALENDVSVNEGKISTLENDVSTNGVKISALENDVSTNGGKISALENDVSAIGGNISAIENDVSINGGKISILKNDVSVNEGKISILENDVSANGGKISALENDITLNGGKILSLEDDVNSLEMKSSFCAYHHNWWESSKVITYEKLLLSDSNIDGASFSISSGQFTSGITGVYNIQFSIGYMFQLSSSKRTDIYLRLNGVNIEESRMIQDTPDNNFEMGGRSMLVNMARGDKLEAYGTNISDLYTITFCVSLVK